MPTGNDNKKTSPQLVSFNGKLLGAAIVTGDGAAVVGDNYFDKGITIRNADNDTKVEWDTHYASKRFTGARRWLSPYIRRHYCDCKGA